MVRETRAALFARVSSDEQARAGKASLIEDYVIPASAILNDDVFDQVQRVLADRRKVYGHPGSGRRNYALSGRLFHEHPDGLFGRPRVR